MSEWQSVLKSTSIEKQTSNEAMDKLMEGLGKVIADYQKEQQTNQSTAAQPTQPTQPTQSRLSEQTKQRVQRLSQKPASGYKSLTQQEVNTFKQGGLPDNKIKELDRKRAESAKQLEQNIARQSSLEQGPEREGANPVFQQSQFQGAQTSTGAAATRPQRPIAGAKQLGQNIARGVRKLPPQLRRVGEKVGDVLGGGTDTTYGREGQPEKVRRQTARAAEKERADEERRLAGEARIEEDRKAKVRERFMQPRRRNVIPSQRT